MGKGGKDLLLKRGNGAEPEVFTSIGGIRSTQFSLEAEGIDVTHQGSDEWKELLDEAGQRSAKISGSGTFLDDSVIRSIQDDLLANKIRKYQVVDASAGGRTWEGLFKLTSFEYAGEFKGDQTYSISMESSGPVAPVEP